MSASLAWGTESFNRADRTKRSRAAHSHSVVIRKVAQLLACREQQADWVVLPARSRVTTPIEDLVGKLRQLERYEAGWDGRAGAAANLASFDDARSFAYLLQARDLVPEESIHANGNAVLVFEEMDLFASLQFYGQGEIAAYVRRGGEEWDEDLVFDRRSLPSVLRDKIGLKGTS